MHLSEPINDAMIMLGNGAHALMLLVVLESSVLDLYKS